MKKKKLQSLERKSYCISPNWFLCGSSIMVELACGDDGFCGGRKKKHPEKNLWSKVRANNKLNPQMAPTGNIPGPHWWEVSTFTKCTSLLVQI